MPDDAEAHYHRIAVEGARALAPEDPACRELPAGFSDPFPLDSSSKPHGISGSTGFPTRLFKAVNLRDGVARAVRRVDGVRVPFDVLSAVVARWTSPAHAVGDHPSVIGLREVPGASPRERATFFAHDFVPGARTLDELFFGERRAEAPALGEELLWRVAADCLLGLRAVHAAGLSMHGVSLERILLAPDGRAMLGGAGLLEALDHEAERSLSAAQAADVAGLGGALLQLALLDKTAARPDAVRAAARALMTKASPQLVHLITACLGRPAPSAAAATELLAPRLPGMYEGMLRRVEALDALLAAEAGSGRMMRLLVKLAHVLDRPEADSDPMWGSAGDGAVLAAMRDAVFHQTDESGRPRLDPSHVTECLHRLDAGDPQRVLLPARDGQSVMTASWATLRGSLHTAFSALAKAADGPVAPVRGGLRPGAQQAAGRRMGVAGAMPVGAIAPAGFYASDMMPMQDAGAAMGHAPGQHAPPPLPSHAGFPLLPGSGGQAAQAAPPGAFHGASQHFGMAAAQTPVAARTEAPRGGQGMSASAQEFHMGFSADADEFVP